MPRVLNLFLLCFPQLLFHHPFFLLRYFLLIIQHVFSMPQAISWKVNSIQYLQMYHSFYYFHPIVPKTFLFAPPLEALRFRFLFTLGSDIYFN